MLYNINETSYGKLQICQNKAMRAIIKCSIYTPISTMFDALQFLTVCERIKVNVSVFIWKMIRDELPGYLNIKLTLRNEVHNYNTRYNTHFHVDLRRTVNAQRDLFYNGLKLYNTLPDVIKSDNNIKHFRKQVSEYVKSQRLV